LSKPNFTAEIINDLRAQVIAHNQAHPDAAVKLGDLKKVYQNGFRGRDPEARAGQAVGRHLASLAKSGFDAAEHPRGAHGEFSRTARAAGHDAKAAEPRMPAIGRSPPKRSPRPGFQRWAPRRARSPRWELGSRSRAH
jgi:hypothetical protein